MTLEQPARRLLGNRPKPDCLAGGCSGKGKFNLAGSGRPGGSDPKDIEVKRFRCNRCFDGTQLRMAHSFNRLGNAPRFV